MTTKKRLREEEKLLEQVLVNNGYPLALIEKSLQPTLHPTSPEEDNEETDGKRKKSIL